LTATVTNPDTEATTLVDGFTYLFAVMVDTDTTSATDLGSVKAYPVPYRPGRGLMTIANLTANADIRIYTVTGELVRTLEYDSSDGRASWDGRNDAGRTVASGVYLVYIKNPAGGNRKIKVALEK
jgi:flagellar hook assembly protein FlgD